jgi:hypothetical protein
MGELIAWNISQSNRLVGDDFQEQLVRQRDELRRKMREAGASATRAHEIVRPIDEAVLRDFRQRVRETVGDVVAANVNVSEDQRSALVTELMDALDKGGVDTARAWLTKRKWRDGPLQDALDRLERHIHEMKAP